MNTSLSFLFLAASHLMLWLAAALVPTGLQAVNVLSAQGVITVLAGAADAGAADGTATDARFNFPYAVAVDSAHNLYVADSNNQTIRKITAHGLVTTLAGSAGVFGSSDGYREQAQFSSPQGVAVDSTGNIYVTDTNNQTIRKITPDGKVTTLAGTAGINGAADGAGDVAQFDLPSGVAVDASGNVYVADSNNQTIRKISPGGVVTTLAGAAGIPGSTDGPGSAARFSGPQGVAVDGLGNVYVADTNNQTIRKITATGVVSTLAGTVGVTGSADGTGSGARFKYPFNLAVNGAGDIYVADVWNSAIRKITTNGTVTTFAGAAGNFGLTDGQGGGVRLSGPRAVAVDNAGNLYVADTGNNVIRKGVFITLSAPSNDFNGDGKADILLSNSVTGDRAMWFMNGVTVGTNAFAGTVPVEWSVSATGDFDSDGKSDLFWTNTRTGDRSVWLMNGNTNCAGAYLGALPGAWVVSGTGDFDGDGKSDVLWTNTATGERSVWLMNGDAVSAGASLGVVPVAWVVNGTGDFNGDGKSDVIWSNTATGDRVMWLMNGTTIGTNAFAGTVPVEWTVSGTDDFDGDGKADIFWTNTQTGDRSVWLMNGNTNSAGGYLGAVPVEWVVSATGDYSGDGKADILWTNTSTGERSMWLMNGITTSGGGSLGVVPVEWAVSH